MDSMLIVRPVSRRFNVLLIELITRFQAIPLSACCSTFYAFLGFIEMLYTAAGCVFQQIPRDIALATLDGSRCELLLKEIPRSLKRKCFCDLFFILILRANAFLHRSLFAILKVFDKILSNINEMKKYVCEILAILQTDNLRKIFF